VKKLRNLKLASRSLIHFTDGGKDTIAGGPTTVAEGDGMAKVKGTAREAGVEPGGVVPGGGTLGIVILA